MPTKPDHDIDLWTYSQQDLPIDYRWDMLQNGKLLNIIFHGGTFGNFTKFFVEKFSNKTPDVKGDPFTSIGTSHKLSKKDYCGLVQAYHSSFVNDNEGKVDLPICLIIPSSEKHFLYLKKAQWFRTTDQKVSPNILYQKPINEMIDPQDSTALAIMKLYGLNGPSNDFLIPKFIVRDWYKLEFLKPLDWTHDYQWFDKFKKLDFFNKQRTFHLDLESFFDWEIFKKNFDRMNTMFDLDLNFDREDEMKMLFDKGFMLDDIRQECHTIDQSLTNGDFMSFDDLDVSTEAYIYAHYEKQNPEIQMPLSNAFFKNTDEILQYLDNFPNWYRKSNPNIG